MNLATKATGMGADNFGLESLILKVLEAKKTAQKWVQIILDLDLIHKSNHKDFRQPFAQNKGIKVPTGFFLGY